jgi:RNA polymerase sigma factor (sigma-70 family)
MSRDFGEMYDDHVWDVYAFIGYRVGNRPDAEDLTQRTFERALAAWRRFDPGRASERTWLLSIARNLVIDHYRANRSGRERSLDALGVELEPHASERYELGVEPALARALAQLKTRDREVIALRFGGDLTVPEIGEMLGLSVANVHQILSRSLRRMRSALSASDGEGTGAKYPEPTHQQ